MSSDSEFLGSTLNSYDGGSLNPEEEDEDAITSIAESYQDEPMADG